jgi:hypothetical protein
MPRAAHRTLIVLLTMAVIAAAQSSFTGTWEGQVNDLPGVELVIRDEAGGVSGSIAFYFQMRGDDGKWHLGEKTTLPLLTPKVTGKVLTFETIHHKKHGSPELGPNNKYRVNLVSESELRLQILKDPAEKNDPGQGLKLTRRK